MVERMTSGQRTVPCPPHTANFVYTITSTGVILFDNHQSDVKYLEYGGMSNALAHEMYTMATKQVPGSLEGRSTEGISTELDMHYIAYILGIMSKSAELANIGGRGSIGHDSNAWLFEFVWGFQLNLEGSNE